MESKGLMDRIDQSTVIHAAVIVVVALVAYHILFHR